LEQLRQGNLAQALNVWPHSLTQKPVPYCDRVEKKARFRLDRPKLQPESPKPAVRNGRKYWPVLPGKLTNRRPQQTTSPSYRPVFFSNWTCRRPPRPPSASVANAFADQRKTSRPIGCSKKAWQIPRHGSNDPERETERKTAGRSLLTCLALKAKQKFSSVTSSTAGFRAKIAVIECNPGRFPGKKVSSGSRLIVFFAQALTLLQPY